MDLPGASPGSWRPHDEPLDPSQPAAAVARARGAPAQPPALRVSSKKADYVKNGFAAAGDCGQPRLRLRARADALWRLLRGEDDADRLFFDGALVMEGDTEYGLILKNTLDAIGPLWTPPTFGRSN